MSNRSVLVIDDEPDIRTLLQEILEDEGYEVAVAASATEANEAQSMEIIGGFTVPSDYDFWSR